MGGLAINLWVLAGWGWMSLSVGLVEPIIILLGPYEQLMLPGILAYGAPIAAYFGLAAYLLQKADQPSPTNTDG